MNFNKIILMTVILLISPLTKGQVFLSVASNPGLTVVSYGGNFFDVSQFHAVGAHVPNCSYPHYHSPGSVTDITGTVTVTDPNALGCGYGPIVPIQLPGVSTIMNLDLAMVDNGREFHENDPDSEFGDIDKALLIALNYKFKLSKAEEYRMHELLFQSGKRFTLPTKKETPEEIIKVKPELLLESSPAIVVKLSDEEKSARWYEENSKNTKRFREKLEEQAKEYRELAKEREEKGDKESAKDAERMAERLEKMAKDRVKQEEKERNKAKEIRDEVKAKVAQEDQAREQAEKKRVEAEKLEKEIAEEEDREKKKKLQEEKRRKYWAREEKFRKYKAAEAKRHARLEADQKAAEEKEKKLNSEFNQINRRLDALGDKKPKLKEALLNRQAEILENDGEPREGSKAKLDSGEKTKKSLTGGFGAEFVESKGTNLTLEKIGDVSLGLSRVSGKIRDKVTGGLTTLKSIKEFGDTAQKVVDERKGNNERLETAMDDLMDGKISDRDFKKIQNGILFGAAADLTKSGISTAY